MLKQKFEKNETYKMAITKFLQNIQTYHEIKGFPEFRIYNLLSKIISLEITSSFSR